MYGHIELFITRSGSNLISFAQVCVKMLDYIVVCMILADRNLLFATERRYSSPQPSRNDGIQQDSFRKNARTVL